MKDEKHYILQFGEKAIIIYSLDNKFYAKLQHQPEDCHYCGYIDKDLLITSSWNGYVHIWNLENTSFVKSIKVGDNLTLLYILKWNDKFAIVAACHKKSIYIIDMEQYKVICQICTNHEKVVKCVKKYVHPIYGESLISASYDRSLKIWSVK